MNALQQALVSKGLAKRPKHRKYRGHEVRCNKCGNPMVTHEGTNIMACTVCNNYFIFDNDKVK